MHTRPGNKSAANVRVSPNLFLHHDIVGDTWWSMVLSLAGCGTGLAPHAFFQIDDHAVTDSMFVIRVGPGGVNRRS